MHRVRLRADGRTSFVGSRRQDTAPIIALGRDEELFTVQTSDEQLAPMFDGVTAPLVVCGHTHMQFDRRLRSLRIINAGSVGMPYGAPGAHWLRLGPSVEMQRTEYDLGEAAAAVRSTDYPQAESFAMRHVLSPPSEGEMLRAFSGSR